MTKRTWILSLVLMVQLGLLGQFLIKPMYKLWTQSEAAEPLPPEPARPFENPVPAFDQGISPQELDQFLNEAEAGFSVTELENRATLVAHPNQAPDVLFLFRFAKGSAQEPEGLEGIYNFARLSLQQQLLAKGLNAASWTGLDQTTFQMLSTVDNWATDLDVLLSVFESVTEFDTKPVFESEQTAMLQALFGADQQSQEIKEHIYGKASLKARDVRGTTGSIANISYEDLHIGREDLVDTNALSLLVSGAVDTGFITHQLAKLESLAQPEANTSHPTPTLQKSGPLVIKTAGSNTASVQIYFALDEGFQQTGSPKLSAVLDFFSAMLVDASRSNYGLVNALNEGNTNRYKNAGWRPEIINGQFIGMTFTAEFDGEEVDEEVASRISDWLVGVFDGYSGLEYFERVRHQLINQRKISRNAIDHSSVWNAYSWLNTGWRSNDLHDPALAYRNVTQEDLGSLAIGLTGAIPASSIYILPDNKTENPKP